jgi:hypothetical protein
MAATGTRIRLLGWRPGEGEEKVVLDAFYGAFSPACFALLGLWLVIVQIRLREWQGSPLYRRRSYGVALHFALGGAIVLAAVRGYPLRPAPAGQPDTAGAAAADRPDQLGVAAYLAAILLYVLIGALAFAGGLASLRIEAILLTLLLFLGFNAAWLLLFDDRYPARGRPPAKAA